MFTERVMHNHPVAFFVHIEIKTTAFFYIRSHFSSTAMCSRARANKCNQPSHHTQIHTPWRFSTFPAASWRTSTPMISHLLITLGSPSTTAAHHKHSLTRQRAAYHRFQPCSSSLCTANEARRPKGHNGQRPAKRSWPPLCCIAAGLSPRTN